MSKVLNFESSRSDLNGRLTVLPEAPVHLVLDGIVYREELCRWLKKSPVTLWRWIKNGYLPKPVKLGQYHVWPANQIAAWAKERGLHLNGGIRHTCK